MSLLRGISSVFILILFSACGGSVPQTIPPKNLFPGQRVFELNKTPAEIAQAKRDFLLTRLATRDPINGTFNYNATRNTYEVDSPVPRARNIRFPTSPIVDDYSFFSTPAEKFPLSVRFPREFLLNIPEKIRQVVIRYDIDTLDLYFTPQSNSALSQVTMIKPHFWAHPNIGHVRSIRGAPFAQDLLVGIFDADRPIDHQVSSKNLLSFNFSVHEDARPTGSGISPNTAQLKFDEFASEFSSFWSLVVNVKERKAVVTLHWIITDNWGTIINPADESKIIYDGSSLHAEYTRLFSILFPGMIMVNAHNSLPNGATRTLPSGEVFYNRIYAKLIDDLEASFPFSLQETIDRWTAQQRQMPRVFQPMLKKLVDLTRY